MSGLSIKVLISIFLAAPPALGQLTPVPSGSESATPGFAPCPDGILCPILPRQEPEPEVVTVVDPDCEDAQPTPLVESANLPVQIRPPVLPTTLVTVTACPGDCEEIPSTVTICPPEGCTTEAQLPPVATRLAICPPEECPECSPDVCTPCPLDDLECEVCEDCPPPCPDYCPPPGEVVTSDQLAPLPTPTPSPSPTTPVAPASPTVTLPGVPEETTAPVSPPVAGAERMTVAPGVYLGVAAVFVAMNWF